MKDHLGSFAIVFGIITFDVMMRSNWLLEFCCNNHSRTFGTRTPCVQHDPCSCIGETRLHKANCNTQCSTSAPGRSSVICDRPRILLQLLNSGSELEFTLSQRE